MDFKAAKRIRKKQFPKKTDSYKEKTSLDNRDIPECLRKFFYGIK